jgi:hypothetical protein
MYSISVLDRKEHQLYIPHLSVVEVLLEEPLVGSHKVAGQAIFDLAELHCPTALLLLAAAVPVEVREMVETQAPLMQATDCPQPLRKATQAKAVAEQRNLLEDVRVLDDQTAVTQQVQPEY